MSKNLGDAFVRVRPDTDDFEPEANRRVSGALRKIAAGAIAVLGASKIKGFLADATTGYRDHLKVEAITAQALKTTGGAAKISRAGIDALSDSLERKTGVDGDAIQSAANLLLTFTNVRNETGKGNQVFTRATGLVTDMSVALGQSATGSAIQLGKALNDPVKGVNALQRVGVSFTEQQKKQIKTLVESGNVLKAQKVVLGELGKEFGGAAAAAADPADRARASYNQLSDEVGSVTVPVMNKLYSVFADRVAPQLLAAGEKYLPAVRRGLLGLINGVNTDGLGAGITRGVEKLQKIDLGKISSSASNLGSSLSRLGPSLAKVGSDSASDSINVFSVVIGFAADHTDLLAKALPFLAAGFIAVKAAQALANAAAIVALPTKIAEVIVNRQLVASNRALVAARAGATAATVEGAAAENVGILTRARSLAGMIAQRVATVAVSVATRAYAAGQWLLNAALTANPIGLIVVAIAALVAGLIIAYKKSSTFRNIVNGAFSAIKNVVSTVLPIIAAVIRVYFNAYRAIIVGVFRGVRAVVSAAWNFIAAVVRRGVALVRAYIAGVRVVVAIVSSAFSAVRNAIASRLSSAVGFVRGIPGRIRSALGNLGSLLFGAGRSLIEGLGRGIVAAFGAILSKVASLAAKIKAHFPGSPVKTGPLTSWNNGGAGKRLVRMLADGLGQTGPVDDAMRRLSSRLSAGQAAQLAIPTTAAGPGRRRLRAGDLAGNGRTDLLDLVAAFAQALHGLGLELVIGDETFHAFLRAVADGSVRDARDVDTHLARIGSR